MLKKSLFDFVSVFFKYILYSTLLFSINNNTNLQYLLPHNCISHLSFTVLGNDSQTYIRFVS